MVKDAEWFYIQDLNDESNVFGDGTGCPIKHDDESVVTKTDMTSLAELVGAKAEPGLSCMRITTVVGSKRHRNPKVPKHHFLSAEGGVFMTASVGKAVGITSHDAEELPVAQKADAELQVNAKPKFGDIRGFKWT